MSRKLMSLEAIESRTLRSATPAPAAEWTNFDLNHDGAINAGDLMIVDSGDYNGDSETNDNDFSVSDALGGTDRIFATINLATNVGFQYVTEDAPPAIESDPLDLNLDGNVDAGDILIVDSGDLNGDEVSYDASDLMIADSHGGFEQLYADLYARVESTPAQATAPEHDALDLNYDGKVDSSDAMLFDSGDLNADGTSWDASDLTIADTFGGVDALGAALNARI